MAELKSDKLKKGSYAIHIYLQAGRGLLSISDKNNVDPIVLVKAFGKTKCTKALKQVTSGTLVSWDDHFYFDKEVTNSTELERERLTIEVRDQRFLVRNSLIGVYEMDLTFIYYQETHAVMNKWVVLSNPESEDFSTVRGYLKISASVLHETDRPIDLTVPAKLTDKEDLMIPPQIKLQTKQLILQFLKAEGLPKMDDNGTVDAYCVARFGGIEAKTSWITADSATMSVAWFEEVMLPVVIPSVSSKLMVTVFDYDRMSREDDMVGSFNFEWSKVVKNEYQDFFWVNIYGGPENVNNDYAKLMNSVTELASNWRGRALMRIFLEDNPRAVLKTQKIQDAKIMDVVRAKYERGTKYEIRTKVLSGVGLPVTDKICIKVKWGDLSVETERVNGAKGCADWYELLQRRFAEIPFGEKVLPDLFVYLCKGDKNICFARLPASEFMQEKSVERWVKLNPDRAIDEVKGDWEGGYVKLHIYIGLFEKDFDKDIYWKVKPVKAVGAKMKLVCNIFQCRSLPPSDASGLADPYVKVYFQGNEISTDREAKVQTLNPIWYEYYIMDVDFVSADMSPPILVYVWDYDKVGSDDIMGVCVIDVNDRSAVTIADQNQAPRPKWFQLNMGKPGTEEGEILISFCICSADFEPNYQITPATKDVTFEINILGLRDLKPSLGWMPVNKAFLKFDLKSLEMPGESQMIQELKTQPFEPGPNPNINTVLSFTTKIPLDYLFCPALTCNVHDYLLMGLSQPRLGTFYIKLGEIIQQSKVRPQTDNFYLEYSKGNPFESSVDEGGNVDSFIELGFARRPSGATPTFYRKSMIAPAELEQVKEKEESFRTTALVAEVRKEPQFEDSDKLRRKIEVNRPNENIYYAIGYNRVPEDGLKHYRYFVNEELERTEYIGKSPFNVYEIMRGQSRGLDGVMDSADKYDEKGQKTNSRCVGIFKGMIRVVDQEEEEERETRRKKLSIVGVDGNEEPDEETEEKKFFKTITKQLLVRTECVIRVYILNCIDLAQRDIDSPSDPYVRLKIGKSKFNDRENYKLDDANPDIYKCYDMNTFLPGDSILKIQLWDFDDILPDDKIGTTKIDLEDRYFSYKWNKLEHKPIETRPLYMKSSRQPQGYVRMWLEIHPSKDRPPPIDITPKPPVVFEARLIVWQSEKVPTSAIEGVSDLYLRAWINKETPKETDTHYRCARGNASWNWRIKFPINLDGKSNFEMMLQLWDRDFFSSNAFLGDASFNFTEMAKEAWDSGQRVQKQGNLDLQERLTRREIPKLWVDFKCTDKNGKESKAGRVQISFELVPEARAKACPVGEGRNEPNIDPPLPKPDGRMEWSLNPMKMMSQMCGPDVRARFCMMISVALCVILLILMFPMIVSNAITQAIF